MYFCPSERDFAFVLFTLLKLACLENVQSLCMFINEVFYLKKPNVKWANDRESPLLLAYYRCIFAFVDDFSKGKYFDYSYTCVFLIQEI